MSERRQPDLDRRGADRRRVCLGGAVRAAAFLPEVACTLRDVSLTGARLRLDPGAVLPGRFDLAVPARGETRRARLVWRCGDAAGVRFEDDGSRPGAAAAAEAAPGPHRRLH